MMGELFAQDGGGLSPLVQQQMAMAGQMQQRPGMVPTRRPMGGRPMPGTGMGAPLGRPNAAAGAQMYGAMDSAFGPDPRGGGNNAGGGRIGGNLGLGGGMDASMWNVGLPGGSLTGV